MSNVMMTKTTKGNVFDQAWWRPSSFRFKQSEICPL